MPEPLTWKQLTWQRPLDPARVAGGLRNWAADARSPRIVLETRLRRGDVLHLLGYRPQQASAVLAPLRAFGNLNLRPLDTERRPVLTAGRLRATTRHRPLRLSDPESVTRALYAAGQKLANGEELTLQLVLGPRRAPLAVPNSSPASTVQPWWSSLWLGDARLDGEKRTALRTKVADHGFAATARLGVTADVPERRRVLLLTLLAALRVAEAPGVQLRFRRESPTYLNRAAAPRLLWPLRLGVPELTPLTGWPLGEADLPGVGSTHPRRLPPPAGTTGTERVIGDVDQPGSDLQLAQPIASARHHTLVTGATGSGKSTLLGNLIAADLAAGRGVIVLEPKGDLVEDCLARVPCGREGDIVIMDPLDGAPVGLNPLALHGRRPELVADGLLHLLRQLHGSNIGPRSADILYAVALTLARRGDATLALAPLLLTNDGVRRSLTTGLRDPLVLEPFWFGFERMSDNERATAVGPLLNKLRPLLRPGLRGVLGQREPRFDVSQVFTQGKALLVPLRRGVIGAEAAQLLGSLVVSEIWAAIQARAAVPEPLRRPVVVYIDEAQDFLSSGVDLAEALAQSRGYNASFVLSHQYLRQWPKNLLDAVLANARSRIVFQVGHDDARVFERGHPEIAAADFTALGSYEIYASMHARGATQPYASGRTRPLPPATSDPEAIRAACRTRYGQPLDEVEAGFLNLAQQTGVPDAPTGRRPRRTS